MRPAHEHLEELLVGAALGDPKVYSASFRTLTLINLFEFPPSPHVRALFYTIFPRSLYDAIYLTSFLT